MAGLAWVRCTRSVARPPLRDGSLPPGGRGRPGREGTSLLTPPRRPGCPTQPRRDRRPWVLPSAQLVDDEPSSCSGRPGRIWLLSDSYSGTVARAAARDAQSPGSSTGVSAPTRRSAAATPPVSQVAVYRRAICDAYDRSRTPAVPPRPAIEISGFNQTSAGRTVNGLFMRTLLEVWYGAFAGSYCGLHWRSSSGMPPSHANPSQFRAQTAQRPSPNWTRTSRTAHR